MPRGHFTWKLAAPRVRASSSERRVQAIGRIEKSARNLFSRGSMSCKDPDAYYRVASNG